MSFQFPRTRVSRGAALVLSLTTWGWGPTAHTTRGLVRVGYYASPGDFDAGLPDFERFLQLLEFKSGKVMSRDLL